MEKINNYITEKLRIGKSIHVDEYEPFWFTDYAGVQLPFKLKYNLRGTVVHPTVTKIEKTGDNRFEFYDKNGDTIVVLSMTGVSLLLMSHRHTVIAIINTQFDTYRVALKYVDTEEKILKNNNEKS